MGGREVEMKLEISCIMFIYDIYESNILKYK